MSAGNGVVPVVQTAPLTNSQGPEKVVEALFHSGYFAGDVKSLAQAYVKVLAGEEYGLSPFAAMNGITIIKGKLGMMTNLMATLVQESGKYSYRVKESTSDKCEIEFFEGDDSLGVSTWTREDSERAGLTGGSGMHEKYPKAMFFNRCMSQGIRTFCPSVTNGNAVYTPEELGAKVDPQGGVTSIPDELASVPFEGGEAAVAEAEVVQLDEDKVEHLAKGMELVGMSLDELNLMLGSLGINAADPVKGYVAHFQTLTDEEFEKVSAELEKRLPEPETEVPAEAEEVAS